MDIKNQFESTVTYRLIRLEYLIALTVLLYLFISHIDSVRWLPAILLFLYIDLIGYLPGAIAFRRSEDGIIGKKYFVLYNFMHSFATQSTVIALWVLIYGWEWTLLVIPIHLCGDRGLFGNYLKPFSVSFEPSPHPAFVAMQRRIESAPYTARTSQPVE